MRVAGWLVEARSADGRPRRVGATCSNDVADTFFATFRQRGPYDLSRPGARPWLYGIATNLIGRHRRAEVRGYRLLERTGIEPFTEGADARLGAQAVRRDHAEAAAHNVTCCC
jgi:RNA polymerase sigma-70 factor (ECF subfamily)